MRIFVQKFYPQNNFSIINEILHNTENFEKNKNIISISSLYTYNGKNKNLKEKKIRDITNNDGNSFIKGFIFNYIENIIAYKYINKIIFIIYIISTFNISEEEKININEILTVLKIIYLHIKQENKKEAYIVLINAFKENSEFEKGLIFFIKFCLKKFIIDNYFLFNIEYLNELITDKYCNELNNQFDYEFYLEEKILPINNEIQYEIIIYYLLPLIFNTNLIIHTNNTNLKKNIFYFKNNISKNNNNKEIINIELNIKFGNTSIIYNELFYEKFKNIIPYVNIEYIYPTDYIEKITSDEICQKCEKSDNCEKNKNFIKIKNNKNIVPICVTCFIFYIKKVINKRYEYLKQDFFLHEEFYCSKIKLTNASENNLFLSLNDIKIILPNHTELNEEIYDIIINNIKCNKCEEKFKNKKYTLCLYNCGHIICDKCFIKYINDITHKRIILNKFELSTEGLQYICPCFGCDNIIKSKYINFFINKYFDDINIYKNKAKDRFEIQMKRFCSKCKKICNEFFYEINNIKHVLCLECKKFLEKQKYLNEKRCGMTKFFCIFCEDNHNFNLIKNFEKNKNKEKNESCCFIF